MLSFSHAIYSFPFDSLADLDGPRRAPPARLRPRDVKRRAYRDGRRRAEAAHKARVEWCRVNRPCRGAGGGGAGSNEPNPQPVDKAENGTANTGGGGGALRCAPVPSAYTAPGGGSGAGGKGIVIIRYKFQ